MSPEQTGEQAVVDRERELFGEMSPYSVITPAPMRWLAIACSWVTSAHRDRPARTSASSPATSAPAAAATTSPTSSEHRTAAPRLKHSRRRAGRFAAGGGADRRGGNLAFLLSASLPIGGRV